MHDAQTAIEHARLDLTHSATLIFTQGGGVVLEWDVSAQGSTLNDNHDKKEPAGRCAPLSDPPYADRCVQ